MALRAVPDHPKFADLKARLKQPRGSSLGWLETIWHFTGRFTPQGNIGKYSDAAIEAWVEWNGAPGELLTALVESGWIDRSEEYRLIIHDWDQHADEFVHTDLARKLLTFANGNVPNSGRLNQHERERFKIWLDGQGKSAKPPGRPAKTQPEGSRKAVVKAAENPKPEPEPEPEPVPVPGVTGASAPPPESPDASFADDEEQNIPDDLPAAMMGNFLLQRLSIPHSHGLAMKFADCVGLIARDERLPRGAAALQLLVRGRDHPPDSGKWRFWLEDGSWKEQVAQGISTEGWE